MAAAVGSRLPDDAASARLFAEFMKFPSTPQRELVDAMRKDPNKVPAFGSPPQVFETALRQRYGLRDELDTPAPQSRALR
jgi:hypothetical protein